MESKDEMELRVGVDISTLSKGVKQLMMEQPLNGLGVMEFGVEGFREGGVETKNTLSWVELG